MKIDQVRLDRLFQALSHPTRREVVERLARGPASVTELASPFDIALPSFVRHLKVLEEARLVRSTKEGRVRTVSLVPEEVEAVSEWLSRQRRMWEQRLDRFDRYARALKEQERKPPEEERR
jgi:DNA-binding transcriptional ArsR family regulator